ncbi:hypothetical protein GW17_00031632, partial [Ensete ventricosum]
ESVLAFDPIAAATSLLSGYGSSITADNIEIADMESIQNGDLLWRPSMAAKRTFLRSQLMCRLLRLQTSCSLHCRQKQLQLEKGIVSLQRSLCRRVTSQMLPALDHVYLMFMKWMDLEAAFGMRRTYSEGDIQVIDFECFFSDMVL